MVTITIRKTSAYEDWYNREHLTLYRKYGKSILIINRDTFNIEKVFKLSEVRASIEFASNGLFIHQYCKETVCGETEFVPSICCPGI